MNCRRAGGGLRGGGDADAGQPGDDKQETGRKPQRGQACRGDEVAAACQQHGPSHDPSVRARVTCHDADRLPDRTVRGRLDCVGNEPPDGQQDRHKARAGNRPPWHRHALARGLGSCPVWPLGLARHHIYDMQIRRLGRSLSFPVNHQAIPRAVSGLRPAPAGRSPVTADTPPDSTTQAGATIQNRGKTCRSPSRSTAVSSTGDARAERSLR